jgi:hypothetical protein
MFGPARLFCRDITEELGREPADVVVADTLPGGTLGRRRRAPGRHGG